MSRKKVIFVFYQTKSQANGGVSSLWQLIKSFDKIDPILITNARTKVVEQAEARGFNIQIVPTIDAFTLQAKLYNSFFWSYTLLKVMLENQIQAIHFNDIIALSYGVIVAKFFKRIVFSRKIKIIFNIRDVFEPQQPYTKKWRLVNLCDDIIVLSEHMKSELYERLPLKNKNYWIDHIHAIYSIVDLERFSPVEEVEVEKYKEALAMNPDLTHWAYVATFNTKKNQMGFINALSEELKENAVVIHFVGDINSYTQECMALVKKLELEEKFIFHGYQSRVENFYHAADLTIVPTKREGLARCMIESLAAGRAVVSFDVSSAAEILTDHDCGIVIPQGDYSAFFQAAKRLTRNTAQEREFSKNGRNLANRFFLKTDIVANYQNIYLS